VKRTGKTIAEVEAAVEGQDKPADKREAPKEFKVEKDKQYGLFVIKYTAGGEVPDELKGKFTNLHRAEAALAAYQGKKAAQEGS
jgi:hypothetical protein